MNRIGKKIKLFILVLVIIFAQSALTLPKAQATPPDRHVPSDKPYLGWSSYSMQVYAGNGSQWITAAQIKAQSDAMHEKLQPFGYKYIKVDAGWIGGSDEYGRPIPSTTLFPNGLQEVIDYVHANGQKIGLYLTPGVSREGYEGDWPIYGAPGCSFQDIVAQPVRTTDSWGFGLKMDFSNPCSQKYVDSVADLLGEWGVDLIKFDSVSPGSGYYDLSNDTRDDVAAWSKAFKRNKIWFELSWALDIKYADYWKEYADSWRVDYDIECYCEQQSLTTWPSILRLFDTAARWWSHGSEKGWNDFDSLNVGNGAMDGLTPDERQTAMSLWAMSASPIYTGNDMTNLDSYGLELLTNTEVIAVNQKGRPAQPVSMESKQQVWYANNGDGTFTVGLFNLGSSPATVNVNWSDIGLTGSAEVRDLWSHTNLGTFETGYSAVNLPPHASRLFTVTSKGGAITVNNDTQDFKYNGNWSLNGGYEQQASSQNLVVAVSDSATSNSAIQPAQASFNKKPSAQADVIVTLALNGNTLSGISNEGTALVAGTDYDVSGIQATIKKEYLADQPVGTKNLVFTFSSGLPQSLSITLSDTSNGVVLSYNDTSPDIVYTGAWGYSSGRNLGDYADDVHYSEANGTSFEFPFAGTGIDLITEKDSSQGDMDIYLDGVFQSTVSTYNASRLAQQTVFSASGLSDGPHTLKAVKKSGVFMLLDRLVVTTPDLVVPNAASFDKKASGQADVKSLITQGSPELVGIANGDSPLAAGTDYSLTGKEITISKAYLAAQPLGTTILTLRFAEGAEQKLVIAIKDSSFKTITVNDTDANISYSGNWGYSSNRGLGDYNDDVHYTETNGDSFQYSFTGTGIELVTEKDSSQGDIDIYLDDVFLQTVGTSGDSRSVQQTVYSASDLADGPHTLKVVKKSGVFMLLDRLNVKSSTATQNSDMDPKTANFNLASQADISTSLRLNDNRLLGVSNGSTALKEGTDYTVAGNTLTIKKDYLATLPEGTLGLTVTFSEGAPQILVVTVNNSDRGRYLVLNDSDLNIAYSGHWSNSRIRGVGDYKDDVHYTEKNDAYFEYTFNGTGIEVITEMDNSQGFMDVYLDGVLQQSISTTSDVRLGHQLVYKATGLSLGSHTIKVVKKSGGFMLLDRLNIELGDVIGPDAASFDKQASAQADVVVNVATDISNFIGISDGGTMLTPGTHYSVSGNQVTIKKEYLATKPVGTTSLTFAFRGDYKNDVRATTTNHDWFEFAFNGTGAELIGPKGPTLGNMDIYVDGVLRTTVNANAATRLTEQSLYAVSGLPNGSHTIKGKKKSGDVMLVDKVKFSVPSLTVVNDSDPAIQYSSGWSHLTSRGLGDYQDDVHFHNAPPANPPSLEYTFNGTGIEVITEKSTFQGKIDIYMDGVFKTTVDTHSPNLQVQRTAYNLQGLAPGNHTIKLLKRTGLHMLLDSFRVTS